MSERWDLNPRSLAPKASALAARPRSEKSRQPILLILLNLLTLLDLLTLLTSLNLLALLNLLISLTLLNLLDFSPHYNFLKVWYDKGDMSLIKNFYDQLNLVQVCRKTGMPLLRCLS